MKIENEMKIKAILPYFGGKRTLAARIVELLGEHSVYWEPFCGSMAVLFAKPQCEMETVNDLNGDVINLAKIIARKESAFELYDRLSRTLYSEQLFREAKERWISKLQIDDLEKAYDFFVVSWMGINGFSGTKRYNYQFALRWRRGGGQGAKRWQSVVSSMPAWHERLQNVVIIRRDAFKVIDNIKDEDGVVVYCDPPYFKKSSKYIHDFEDAGHKQLAESFRRFEKARVIVSYYDCPAVRKLYEGSEFIKIAINCASLRNATRGEKNKPHRQQEILISNKPIVRNGLFGH